MASEPISPKLIQRIVGVDARFTVYNNARTLRFEDGCLEEKSFGNATAFRDKTHASTYYNRVLGLGEAELSRLDEIIAFHAEIGKASTITLTPDHATPRMQETLRERGYALADTNCVFATACSPSHGDESPIEIRRAGPEDIDVVVTLWNVGHEDKTPPEVVERRASAQWVPEFPIYLAQLDGQIAAKATMYLADGVAWLGNAETFPRFRRRGCQLALLNHRIREAATMGCEWAVSDTEHGTISHRNIERAGMKMAYTEQVLTGPKPA